MTERPGIHLGHSFSLFHSFLNRMGSVLYVAANAANGICAGRKRKCAENDSNRDKSGQLHHSLSNGMRVSALFEKAGA